VNLRHVIEDLFALLCWLLAYGGVALVLWGMAA
jgi:hypothetical protein